MAARRPNILFIMSDEHDPAVTGCYGDRVVQTPHLDRLAAEGVTFDACYTPSPLCVPARQSFTCGKYVSRCGIWNNSFALPDDCPSLPRTLIAAGYQPYLNGKMHYPKERRYGFIDADPRSNPHRMTGTGERRDPASTDRGVKSWEGRRKLFYCADETDAAGHMGHDVNHTRLAKEFLQQRSSSDAPFFMQLGYLSPHFPLIVPQKYYDAVKGRVPMPHLPENWFQKLPTNYKHLINAFGIPLNDPDSVRLGRELYWALTGWIDDQIGQVLRTLRESSVADNTIVIYTSDHGENKGDHGMWWKNNMYEHSSRVPLIVHWPERFKGGQRRSGVCSLLDVVKTVAEISGGSTPGDWNGDSMLSYLDNPSTKWKDMAVSEYYGHNIASGFAMIRQGAWKYTYHCRMNEEFGPERELYNLNTDPGEWNNLANDPAQRERVGNMHAALVKELGREPDSAEAECRADFARGHAMA